MNRKAGGHLLDGLDEGEGQADWGAARAEAQPGFDIRQGGGGWWPSTAVLGPAMPSHAHTTIRQQLTTDTQCLDVAKDKGEILYFIKSLPRPVIS